MDTFSSNLQRMTSGVVTIELPAGPHHPGLNRGDKIVGILKNDIQVSFQNKWAPLKEFDDIFGTLQEAQQVWGTKNISDWISGSSAAWNGASYVKVSLDFYLISFNSGSNIMRKARILSELMALNVTDSISIQPHHGYQYNVLPDNKAIQNIATTIDKAGTVRITSGNMVLKDLLVYDLNVTPSSVCVKNGQPLYYDINMVLNTYRTPVLEDISVMFGGN